MGGTRHVHAAAGHGEGRSQRTERLAQIGVDRVAGGLGEVEPSPGVRVDHPVRPDDPVQLTVQDLREDAVARLKEHAGHGGVREHRHPRSRGQPADRVEPHDDGAHHDAAAPRLAGESEIFLDRRGAPRELGEVHAMAAGLPVRLRHRFLAARHPLAERGRRLVGQVVVVLDDVDPAEREPITQLRELLGGEPHRLEGRAQEGAPLRYAAQRADARDAEPRPAERSEQGGRPFDPGHENRGLHRDVAEQQVQELRDLAPDRGRIVGDRDAPAPLCERRERLHAADHARGDVGRHALGGQLDRLLERDVPRPGFGILAGRAAELVCDPQALAGYHVRACRPS